MWKGVIRKCRSLFGFDKVGLEGAGLIDFYLLGFDGLLINGHFSYALHHDPALSIEDGLKSNSLHL